MIEYRSGAGSSGCNLPCSSSSREYKILPRPPPPKKECSQLPNLLQLRAGEALDVLKNTLARHPYDRDVLTALISYEIEAAQFSTALEYAERLVELEPDNAEVAAFVERLRRRTR